MLAIGAELPFNPDPDTVRDCPEKSCGAWFYIPVRAMRWVEWRD